MFLEEIYRCVVNFEIGNMESSILMYRITKHPCSAIVIISRGDVDDMVRYSVNHIHDPSTSALYRSRKDPQLVSDPTAR